MNKIDFDNKNLIERLKEKIPETVEYIFPEFEFSAYITYGAFGGFLRDKIMEDNPNNSELIIRSFDFLNELTNYGDYQVLQMLRVETFEMLTDNEVTIEKSKLYLKGTALVMFSDVIKFLKE